MTPPRQPRRDGGEAPPQPVDVQDGIPDRSARRPAWRLVAIFAAFAAWVGFLIYCQLAGL